MTLKFTISPWGIVKQDFTPIKILPTNSLVYQKHMI